MFFFISCMTFCVLSDSYVFSGTQQLYLSLRRRDATPPLLRALAQSSYAAAASALAPGIRRGAAHNLPGCPQGCAHADRQ